ncbi:MAG: TolC family protein [Deltaproteobacteria bacterium]|nr:TolC family protein [Deltaproteobacteria bacterium]
MTVTVLAVEGRAATPTAEHESSLGELLELARLSSPSARLATLRLAYGDAARASAEPLFPDNPTLELGVGPRLEGGDYDVFATFSQPVEVAGERGLRITLAARFRERLEAELAASAWDLRREVTLSYHTAVIAREGAELADRLLEFAGDLLAIARRRRAAGDSTSIELRIAEIEHARAREAKLAADQALRSARVALAEVTGSSIDAPPNVPRGLEPPRTIPSLARLLRLTEAHPALRARRLATGEAHAHKALADREAWPTPVLGAQVARESASEGPPSYVVLGTIAAPLPFWQRNQGERARARAAVDVAEAKEISTARALRSRVVRTHGELSVAVARLAIFTSSVAPSLEDNLALLRRGFEAGELSVLALATARERFLEAQRDALSAYADCARARSELESAAGAELSLLDEVGNE